jgi:15-cis-phytoene synthase
MASSIMSDSAPDGLQAAAYAHCTTLLRQHDADRYFAGLFAPADKRGHLAALYAFSLDVARVREAARQPAAGEIRLQWWREALEGSPRGDVAAHPIAAALLATIERFRLPRPAFVDLIDARTFDLYDDAMMSVADLEGYCGETSSALIRLATLILADGDDAGGAEAAGHAGVAYAIAGLLRAFPWHARAGQLYVPADVLARHDLSRDAVVAGTGGAKLRGAVAEMRGLAHHHLARFEALRLSLDRTILPAFLPLAVVPLYLKRMERRDYDPYRTIVEISQWRRLWALWHAARV